MGKLDRLARDLALQEQALQEVWGHGGEVSSTLPTEANLRNDDDDPSRCRKMIRHILGALNEWERKMVRLRTRNGRRAKAAKGGYSYGAPPFGYRAEGRVPVVDPDEAATIARIQELRAEGRSLRQIADVLTAERRRTKRGGTVWHPPTVARVLERADVPTGSPLFVPLRPSPERTRPTPLAVGQGVGACGLSACGTSCGRVARPKRRGRRPLSLAPTRAHRPARAGQRGPGPSRPRWSGAEHRRLGLVPP